MTQSEAKKIIITSFSDTILQNKYKKSDINYIVSIRNKAFYDEMNYGNGDYIKALNDIKKYIGEI